MGRRCYGPSLLGWGLMAMVLTAPLQATERVAVTGGRVIPVNGEEIEGGTVLIEDGRIQAVGKDIVIPFDAKVIDASGKVVFPGMIECHTSMGLDRPNENASVAPYLDVADSVDPSSVGFEEALRSGVTTLGISHGNNCVVGAMSRAVRPIGLTAGEMTVKSDTGLKISMAPRSRSNRMVQMAQLREVFRDLSEYMGVLAESKYEEKLKEDDKKIDVGPEEARNRGKDLVEADDIDDKHRNLKRLTDGQIGATVYCGQAMDVAPAIDLAKENGFSERLVLVLGTECYKAVDLILATKRPVILVGNLIHRERDSFSGDMKEVFVPSVYAKKGVPFALLSESRNSLGEGFLWYQAARCVRNGLDRKRALEAITQVPAQVLGLQDRVGSLEPGKDGNLLILSGDPLDGMSWVEHVMIEGKIVYEREKDIRLQELLQGITRDEAAESEGEGAADAGEEKTPESSPEPEKEKKESSETPPKKEGGSNSDLDESREE